MLQKSIVFTPFIRMSYHDDAAEINEQNWEIIPALTIPCCIHQCISSTSHTDIRQNRLRGKLDC